MSGWNIGSDFVDHKKNCRCDECEVERLTKRIKELEAALPKWTRIDADDKSTHPEVGEHIMYKFIGDTYRPEFTIWDGCVYAPFMWRPLCDLDYPEQGESDE